jgi:hypothetical protein
MTAELRRKLKKLWRDKIRYDRLYGLTGNEEFLQKKRQVVDEVFNIVPMLPYYEILQPYDPFANAYFIFDFILRILAFMPLERAHQFRRKQWQQYCGFGENWRKKKNYNRNIKRIIVIYLLNSAFPKHLPPKTMWGEILRNEIKRLNKTKKKLSSFHILRLALLNVGRKLVIQLWRRAKEVTSNASCGADTASEELCELTVHTT